MVNFVPSQLGLYLIDVTALHWVPEPDEQGSVEWSCVPSEEFGALAQEKEIIPEMCYPTYGR